VSLAATAPASPETLQPTTKKRPAHGSELGAPPGGPEMAPGLNRRGDGVGAVGADALTTA